METRNSHILSPHYHLTGKKAQEYTNASTTALVNAKTKDWDAELIRRLGLPEKIFQKISPAGSVLGEFSEEIQQETGLNMTVVMASSFVPVPFTIILYNKIVNKKGLGFGYRYILTIFSIGMLVMYFCNVNSPNMSKLALTAVAILGGVFVSFAIGAFFSVTYTVPSHLAMREKEEMNQLSRKKSI